MISEELTKRRQKLRIDLTTQTTFKRWQKGTEGRQIITRKSPPLFEWHLFTMPSSTTFHGKLRTGLKENPQRKERGGRKTNRGDDVPEPDRQKKDEEDDEILLDWVPYPSEATRARVLKRQQATARQTRENPAGNDHPGSPWITNGSGNVWIKIRNQQRTYQLARYIRFEIVKGTPTIYGTMGIGESEIGDPLSKIKMEGIGQLLKTGQKGKKSEEGCRKDSKHQKSWERSSS